MTRRTWELKVSNLQISGIVGRARTASSGSAVTITGWTSAGPQQCRPVVLITDIHFISPVNIVSDQCVSFTVFTVKHLIWNVLKNLVEQTSKQWLTLQQRLSWCQRWLKGVRHLTLLLITEWTRSLTGRFERFDCCVFVTRCCLSADRAAVRHLTVTRCAGTLLKTPARRFLH